MAWIYTTILALVSLLIVGSLAPASYEPISLQQVFAGGLPNVDSVWGQGNVIPFSTGSGVRVLYPQGSIDPGNSPPYPLGGAGFEYWFQQGGAPSHTLTYKVKFEPGFQFNLGGKLPGLFGGSDPRGCIQATDDGFSARLMWRADGAGELYLYSPGQDSVCGQSIGRGNWTFVPGVWYIVTVTATVNDVGSSNGVIEVLINGTQVVYADGLTLRNTDTTQVDGLLFSTFFGGDDASWASPQDQWVGFAAFSVR